MLLEVSRSFQGSLWNAYKACSSAKNAMNIYMGRGMSSVCKEFRAGVERIQAY